MENFKVETKGNNTDGFIIKISQRSYGKKLTTFEIRSKINSDGNPEVNIFSINMNILPSKSKDMEHIAKYVTFNGEK